MKLVFLACFLEITLKVSAIAKCEKSEVSEEDKLDPVGLEISKMLSPENKPNIIEEGKAKKKKKRRNSFFRSKSVLTPEETVADSIYKKLKDLPCKEGCGTFSHEWRPSFDAVVELFQGLETDPRVDNDIGTYMQIFQDVLEKLYEKEGVREKLVKSAYLKALKLRNDTEGIHVDPAMIFPTLETKNVKTSGFRASSKSEVPWEKLKKTPSRVQGEDIKLDFFREDDSLHVFHYTFHAMNFGKGDRGPRPRENEHFFYLHRLFLYRYFDERDTEDAGVITPLNSSVRETEFNSYYSITPQTDPTKSLHSDFVSNKPTCRISETTNSIINKHETRCDSSLAETKDSIEKYGKQCMDFHNYGHDLMSNDCKSGGRGTYGLLIDSEVSARDPLFYRWHYEVDIKYDNFLKIQPPYTREQVQPAKGITVSNIVLESRCSSPNQVETFWEMKTSRYQLNHMDYLIKISLKNSAGVLNKVIIRVFLVKEKFIADTKYYFELDRFTQNLTGAPEETIIRFDNQSSLTWRKKDECGWPTSLLLPKGKSMTPIKYRLVVFVHDLENQAVSEGQNNVPEIPCGSLVEDQVPDPRPHGFPIDRQWTGINLLDVVNNKDSTFGRISTSVEILNRGLNPTGCEDAEFTPTSSPISPEEVSTPLDTPVIISPTVSPASISPIDTPAAILPSGTPAAIPPIDTPAVISPTVSPVVVLPINTPAAILPSDTPAAISPTVSPAVVLPINTPAAILPSDTPAAISPTVSPAVVSPIDTPAPISPTVSPAVVLPINTPAAILPSGTPAAISPIDTPSAILPSDTPAAIPPVTISPTVPLAAIPTTVSPAAIPPAVSPVAIRPSVSPVAIPPTVSPAAIPPSILPSESPARSPYGYSKDGPATSKPHRNYASDLGKPGIEVCADASKSNCFQVSAKPLDSASKAEEFCEQAQMSLAVDANRDKLVPIVINARELLNNKHAMFWIKARHEKYCKVILKGYRRSSIGISWTLCEKSHWNTGQYFAICEPI